MPGEHADAPQQRITELEEQVQNQADRIEELEQRLEARPKTQTLKWMLGQVQDMREDGGGTGTDLEDMTTVERMAQMPLAERQENISASELRATLIFENWTEWAKSGPYGDEFLTTAQTSPATLRVLLREVDPTVDASAGEDLQRTQLYRAMRALHRLTEGAMRYDEDHTSPDNTDGGKCHALVLERPGEMPTLRQ